MRTCKYCKKTFDTTDKCLGWMANHVRWCHKNPNRSNGRKIQSKICPGCKKEFNKRNKYCTKECKQKNFRMSESARKKISEGRKKYLKKNPDKHPWKKADKFVSPPCEYFKAYLDDKNIKYVEEYSPLEDRHFSIDIAFPDVKIGIEINGEQHYNRDGTLGDYYQDRHDKITKAGWKLYEIHSRHAFQSANVMEKIDLGEQPDYTEYFKKKEKKKTLTKKEVGARVRAETDEINKPLIPLVEQSGIDFSKFGWVAKVSKVLDIKPQKVNGWMKRYMNDFYEKKCYKRK